MTKPLRSTVDAGDSAVVSRGVSPICLTISGVPAPKGSRTVGRRRDGSVFTRPASGGEYAWVEAVARTAQWRRAQALALPAAGELPAAPYAVTLAFYCQRPARPAHAHPSRHDLDKLCRAVLDGLVRGGLLVDDRHVVELAASKAWAAAPGGEGVHVTIAGAEDHGAPSRGMASLGCGAAGHGRSHGPEGLS